MKYPKRSQYKYAKSRYRVRNWAEYEAGLRKRCDLTVWLSDNALDAWRAVPSCGFRRMVPTYSTGREPPIPLEESHLIQGKGATDRSEATLAAWVTPRRSWMVWFLVPSYA